jgi:hypothetical protein
MQISSLHVLFEKRPLYPLVVHLGLEEGEEFHAICSTDSRGHWYYTSAIESLSETSYTLLRFSGRLVDELIKDPLNPLVSMREYRSRPTGVVPNY